MLAGKTIVVGITGGVAAHYLPELIGQNYSQQEKCNNAVLRFSMQPV
jgi:phosphopantothenoylcysteine synthetase/decarboxylase